MKVPFYEFIQIMSPSSSVQVLIQEDKFDYLKNPSLDFQNSFCFGFLWSPSNAEWQNWRVPIFLRFNLVKNSVILLGKSFWPTEMLWENNCSSSRQKSENFQIASMLNPQLIRNSTLPNLVKMKYPPFYEINWWVRKWLCAWRNFKIIFSTSVHIPFWPGKVRLNFSSIQTKVRTILETKYFLILPNG